MIPEFMQFYLDLEFESENEKVHSSLTFKGYFNYKMKRMVDPYWQKREACNAYNQKAQ